VRPVGIRAFLTQVLGEGGAATELSDSLRAMRAACGKFMSALRERGPETPFACPPPRRSSGSWGAAGKLRGVVSGAQMLRVLLADPDDEGARAASLPPPVYPYEIAALELVLARVRRLDLSPPTHFSVDPHELLHRSREMPKAGVPQHNGGDHDAGTDRSSPSPIRPRR
jgi:hypothetical protein